MDTLGMVWALAVTPAGVQDRDGAKPALSAFRARVRRPKVVWADGAYESTVGWARDQWGWRVEVVRRTGPGFQVLPKRWIVERTFGWLNRHRRLSKDYERTAESSAAMVHLAMIALMARRLAGP